MEQYGYGRATLEALKIERSVLHVLQTLPHSVDCAFRQDSIGAYDHPRDCTCGLEELRTLLRQRLGLDKTPGGNG